MNPPSALQGAMGRERKPFTYTPGGLDLSEIKSERMAKRLMRNAMNQGVPELPPQPVQSPTTPTTPIAVPNFNALPVQVFPAFNLPANPKSLLKTRSIPDRPREPLTPKIPQPTTQNINSFKPSGMDQLRETLSNNLSAYNPVNNSNNNSNRPTPAYEYNNNRPTSMYEFSATPNTVPNLAKTTYGSDAYTSPVLPEICYDAEFFQVAPRPSNGLMDTKVDSSLGYTIDTSLKTKENVDPIKTDFTRIPQTETVSTPAPETETIAIEDDNETDNDDQTVKVIKKVKKAEKKVESEVQNQNGDQNGETDAEMTVVKVPAKKSSAKTETNVEVVKKTLPDGSIEETKTTTTKTTVDGKTSISTKKETQIIPKAKEEVEEVEEEEEEEEEVVVEEEEENEQKEEEPTTVVVKKTVTQAAPVVNTSVVKKEESSETTTTKKVVVVQNDDEVEEEEEEDEEEPDQETTTVVIKKTEQVVEKKEEKEASNAEVKQEQEEEEEEEVVEEEVKVEAAVEKQEPPKKVKPEPEEEEEEVEEEEEYEEAEEPEDKPEQKPEPKPEQKPEPKAEPKKVTEDEEEESEYTEEEIESEKEETPKTATAPAPSPAVAPAPAQTPSQTPAEEPEAPKPETEKVQAKLEGKDEETNEQVASQPVSESVPEPTPQPAPQPETKVPLREPSIPLEKVEDVEIKPIGSVSETISKSHTEKTEIISGLPENSSGAFSTQTEYNKIENIVTVNRTTKTLDRSYEQLTQQGVPTVRTYFAPGRERVSPTPQPAKPYQPFYTQPPPQPQVERRHSLLLERLSTERQMPSDIYQKQTSYQQQYSNQNYEQQRQWSQEPQSEVVNDSNIKPSAITKNQQWYQQSKKENVLYNNVTPSTPAVPSQQWSQPPPQQPQPQVQHQPQIQIQPQSYHQQPYEIYTDNSLQDSSKLFSNTYQQQNSYPSYTPAPNNWSNSNVGSTLPDVNTQSNQYSYLNKTSSENYQNTNQQYSSSYVPPPWEQDPNYVAPQLSTQSFYQPEPPTTNTFNSAAKPDWKPSLPTSKFSKPAPKSFIPPAPNQSFVKTAVPEPAKRPGCKTYYSEYERRYITVPESTYIPADAKFQAQPDPSPQYYYDNNEPSEAVEHQWRKELREFTEKSQTTQTQQMSQQSTQQSTQQVTQQTSVIPPWEEDPKYAKVPTVSYTPTPSWSQTVQPQSNRERTFESEYITSNEWSKTNTLGRSRPLSTYQNSNIEPSIPERPRGVSVDRYNPTKYQSPMTIPYDSEHGPVQAHTLDPTPSHQRGYHNPNVPAYHVNRASAEPREHQQTTGQARNWHVDSRATPIQSRSFKYLQWITGTED